MLTEQLKSFTRQRLQQGLYRQRILNCSEHYRLQFGSSDYLSLSKDPRVQRAYTKAFKFYPSGSSGSMMVAGYHPIHRTLEQVFAEVLQVDACVLFSSGYVANLSVLNMLGQMGAHVIMDKQVHASIYDGVIFSGTSYTRYPHQCIKSMRNILCQVTTPAVVVTEGIFSMGGQPTSLKAIAHITKELMQDMIVDEAHSFGILGPQGLGAVMMHGLTQDEVPLRVIPLSKSFSSTGAIVAGQAEWITALLQMARPYIYSAAPSPAMAYGLLETLAILQSADNRREKLAALVAYFRQKIGNSPLSWRDSSSPIQQLQLGCPHKALKYAAALKDRGIFCVAMRQPTVSKEMTGLRIILNYHHEPEHIDDLLRCLHDIH